MRKKKREPIAEAVQNKLNVPVDTDTFKFALSLFQEAATGRMAGSHIPKTEEAGWQLTNVPMNRGMLAIVRETRHLSEEQRQSLMLRVMHFGETIEDVSKDARFTGHVELEAVGMTISNEFMDAYAACQFRITGERIVADIEQLASQLVGKAPT